MNRQKPASYESPRDSQISSFAAKPLLHPDVFDFVQKYSMTTATDNKASQLLDKLDEGWFAKPSTTTSKPSPVRIASTRPPRPPDIRTSSPVPPLDLHDNEGASGSSNGHQGGRNNLNNSVAMYRDGVGNSCDTPRTSYAMYSYQSVASTLPQTQAELDDLDRDEIEQLVEDAEELQQRAAHAAHLARQRLKPLEHDMNSTAMIMNERRKRDRKAIYTNTTSNEWNVIHLIAMILDLWILALRVVDMTLHGTFLMLVQIVVYMPHIVQKPVRLCIGCIEMMQSALVVLINAVAGMKAGVLEYPPRPH